MPPTLATALIGRGRRVGGNQFRHAMATLAILIDYHFADGVLLIEETLEFVYPMALEINIQMSNEITDLIDRRRRSLHGK